MRLKDHIKHTPIPYDLKAGQEVAHKCGLKPGGVSFDFICAVAGCSPYLCTLLQKERDWVAHLWNKDPSEAFKILLKDVKDTSLGVDLRQAKRRVALLVALCDLGGVWTLQDVTQTLTMFADFAVERSLRYLVRQEIERGKLPEPVSIDPKTCAGIFVLAMGKMGAHELNYSSDIDLICLFDETRYAPEHLADIRPVFIRIVKNLCKLLSEITSEGYVFRTDLRLRPNPAVTPVCISAAAALSYYETEGRTWERAAFIKARPCAGDIAAGERFLQTLRPFVWRKYLDFAAIQDAHDMRLRIQTHKGLKGPIKLQGHDLKLGRGGIREIEFFAQTNQIIAGGRDDTLRCRETVRALGALAKAGWVNDSMVQYLVSAYEIHRSHEHRLQMIGDVQTHSFPLKEEEIDRLARFCGADDTSVFCQDIEMRLVRTHHVIESFFTKKQTDTKQSTSKKYDDIFASWRSLSVFRSPRALEIFNVLKPRIAEQIEAARNPDEVLHHFEAFLSDLPAGVQLFSLFEANGQILDLVLDILATAPALATYLARNSKVLDVVLAGDFFDPLPSREILVQDLKTQLARSKDYEDRLNVIRRWMKEQHFRIGVLQLRHIADAFEASKSYSDLAAACIINLLPIVKEEFASKYGQISEGEMAVLAMGKLGSREMTATSDLDLIMIYDADNQAVSDGQRALPSSQYFARFAQTFVTALSSPTAEGKLYDVDMRLRPSGRKGPVATSLTAFKDYQKTQAWTWEHLALTRADVVAGPDALHQHVQSVHSNIVQTRRDSAKIYRDVRDMRARLAQTKSGNTSFWDIKEIPGGLLDIELLAQTFALIGHIKANAPQDQLSAAAKQDLISKHEGLHLIITHKLLSQIQHICRLLLTGSPDIKTLGQAGRAHILKATGFSNQTALETDMKSKITKSETIIQKYLQYG